MGMSSPKRAPAIKALTQKSHTWGYRFRGQGIKRSWNKVPDKQGKSAWGSDISDNPFEKEYNRTYWWADKLADKLEKNQKIEVDSWCS